MTPERRADRRRCPLRRSRWNRARGSPGVAAACAFILALGTLAPATHAQSWEIRFSEPILSPETPSTTVTLWATFPPADWAFGAADLDLHSSESGWSEVAAVLPRPGQNPGVIEPGGVTISGISVNQIWSFVPPPPDPANPLAVWQATFTATDFARRDITISTLTSRYEVFREVMSVVTEPRTPIDIEASIRVIPAPAPLVLLALGAMRRRRPDRRTPRC